MKGDKFFSKYDVPASASVNFFYQTLDVRALLFQIAGPYTTGHCRLD